MSHPYVEIFEQPQDLAHIGAGRATTSREEAPVHELSWGDGRVVVAGEVELELDETRPFSVQLSRWRRQIHEDRLIDRVRVVDELHVEIRPSAGPRVAFFAELDPGDLNGLPWLERNRDAQLDRSDVDGVLGALAAAGGRPTRWQTNDLGTAPEIREARDLGLFSTISVAASGGVLGLVGQMFVAIGLPIFIVLGSMADLGELTFEPSQRVDGRVVDVERTGASENETPVLEYTFEYELDGTTHEGTSYETGASVDVGDPVTVEVGDEGRARIAGMRMSQFGPLVFFLTLIFPAIGAAIALFALRKGLRNVRVLCHGRLTRGTLTGKRATNTKVNNRRVMELTFGFTDHRGKDFEARARAVDTRRLEDEATERILYLEDRPGYNMVVDELDGSLTIGPDGELQGRASMLRLILPLVIAVEVVLALMVVVGLFL